MLRVLSLWQPWASLCVVTDPNWTLAFMPRPAKQYETRHWRPKQSLPIDVAIHATKKYLPPMPNSRMSAAMARCRISPIPRGAIIGVGTITQVLRTEDLVAEWRGGQKDVSPAFADEIDFGDYRYGRFAWRLDHVRALAHPIPFRGRQEVLYALDEETTGLIAIALSGINPQQQADQ